MMGAGREPNVYRVAVIGAGPAGLAAALTLSRSLQATIVFDSPQEPRNAASRAIGGLLGRDLIPPHDLRQLALNEIERYNHASFSDQQVERIERRASESLTTPAGFTILQADGMRVDAEYVLLACGMVDRFPDIGGLDRFWAASVINCPFCDGFEVAHRPWGVVVNRAPMLDVAEVYRTWSDDLILFIAPDIALDAEREAGLAARGIGIERRAIRRLLGEGSQLRAVELDDGARISREALVLWPLQCQTDLVSSMAVPLDDDGCVIVDEGFRTKIDGIYAAGDLVYSGHQNVNTAIHMGNLAAATMVLDLAAKSAAPEDRTIDL